MNILRYYVYCILLHLTLAGSSLVQVGDAVSVNLDTSATYKHLSNILKTKSNEISDDVFVFTPGAAIRIGRSEAPLDFTILTKYDIYEYQYYKNLDTNLLRISLDGSFYPSEIFSGSFSYSNIEGQSSRSEESIPQANTLSLIETQTESASFYATYQYSPKMSFSLGVSQSDLVYDSFTDVLSSKKVTSIPLRLIYKFSDKLNVLYGVSFSNNKVGQRFIPETIIIPALLPGLPDTTVTFNRLQSAYETDSYYYNLGLSGVILPKLTGSFDFGYRTLSFSNANFEYNAIGGTSSLIWAISPKLRTSVNFSRNFDSAGNGVTYKSTNLQLNTVYTISTDYRLSVGFGQIEKSFRENTVLENESRDDTLENLSLNVHYYPSENYNFSLGYTYFNGDSDDVSGRIYDFSSEEFRISANLKY